MADQYQVSFNYTTRYFSEGNNKTPRKILFVFHGYGQLAEYFIRKFQCLAERDDFLIIAPEGLSRFYLEGFSGRVGATWMTKEDRQRDIENYINYLNEVFNQVLSKFDLEDIEISILGFSQGAATSSRWVLDGKIKFDRLILWAGVFPEDMNIDKGNNLLSDKTVKLVFGDKDPFVNAERLNRLDVLLNQVSFKHEKVIFNGGHDIDQSTLISLF